MVKCFRYLYFLLLLCSAPVIHAQDVINDAGLWMNFYFEKKLDKHWALHLNQQDRINENMTRWILSYADVGVTYKFNKTFSVMGDYVISQNRKQDLSFKTRHQGYVAFMVHARYRNWKLNYRNMVQAQVEEVYSSERGAVPVYYERNKLTLKYEINKYLTAYTAGELYYPLYQARNKGFDRSRTFIGMFYNLNKSMAIEGYFLFQKQLNAFGPTKQFFVYGLGYSYAF